MYSLNFRCNHSRGNFQSYVIRSFLPNRASALKYGHRDCLTHTFSFSYFQQTSLKETHRRSRIFHDITRRRFVEMQTVDLSVSGFPCQPFSIAGKQQGFRDEKGPWLYLFSHTEVSSYLHAKDDYSGKGVWNFEDLRRFISSYYNEMLTGDTKP